MNMKRMLYTVLLFLISLSLQAQHIERRIDSLFQLHVNKGEIHGCLTYVFQKGDVLHFKPYGYSDVENQTGMARNIIFRMASMSKIMTSVAALTLLDKGLISLLDPVKKYIPEFATLTVISPGCKDENNLITEPLARDVTILDLCRHTAGFGYGGDDPVGRIYARNYREGMNLHEFVVSLTKAPLKYQPGTKWEYSFSTDILGYLIEVVSGKPLDEYMDEVIFKPLGMHSTGFYVPEDKLYRLCNFYEYTGTRLLLMDKAEVSKLRQPPAFLSGGAGCVSTMHDFSVFCQMLLDSGEYKGKRVLKPETVELLLTDQISDIRDRAFEIDGFSFGMGVNNKEVCWWAGGPYNNTFMIDYKKRVIAILLIQNAPWQHLQLMSKFRNIVNEESM